MLSRFFGPTRPIDTMGKTWVEGRMRWLADQFGMEPFLARPIALPNYTDFPEIRGGASLQSLYERICDRIGIDPARVPLVVEERATGIDLVNDDGHGVGGEAAHYSWDGESERIVVQATELGDPISLIGTLAHELSHARLFGEGRVTGNDLDDELLTDLCAVHHGLGLFLANQPRAWLSDCGTWPGSKIVRPMYMTVHFYAWALAHRALLVGDRNPDWLRCLDSEPRRLVRDGIRWLTKYEDSAFQTGGWSAWEELAPQLAG